MNPLDALDNGINLFAVAKGIHNLISKEPELVIAKLIVSDYPPIRLAYDRPVNPDLMPEDFPSSIDPNYYRERATELGHVGSCRVHASIENRGCDVASIRSISVSKTPISQVPVKGSIRFSPQGDQDGDPKRFLCHLDKDAPYVRRIAWGNHGYEPVGDNNFFEFGRVEIEPGHTAEFVIYLYAQEHAYSCSVSFRAESRRMGTYTVETSEPVSMTVIPVSFVPVDQRFEPNYSPCPPHLSHEQQDDDMLFDGLML